MSRVDEAAVHLAAGRVVVLPTDTVYGVASGLQPAGVDALFRLKRRPRHKAIPVLAASAEEVASVAQLDRRVQTLASRFWPGPLTLVLPRAPGFDLDLGGTDPGSVAVRVPEHPLARELLVSTGPLAVTSANGSGDPPADSIEEARRALGETVAIYLDGGRAGGKPSTVAVLRGSPIVIRQGAISEAEIRSALSAS